MSSKVATLDGLDYWQRSAQENRTFNRITWGFVVATLVFASIVQLTTLSEISRAQREEVPAQLTRIIERVEIQQPKKVELQQPEPEIEQQPIEKEPVEPQEQPVVTANIVEPDTQSKLDIAREQASNSGLLAMADDLAAMRDMVELPSTAQPLTQQALAPEPKSQAVEAFEAKTVTVDSGGAKQSGTQDIALVERQVVTLGEAQIAKEQRPNVANVSQQPQSGATPLLKRKATEIRLILDRNKGAFYTIYRRALRKDPTLEGKVTMMIVVKPNGQVSDCRIISSELDVPALERKLIARVKLINFGKEIAETTSINYSFNFLPY